jgi:Fe2+ or Zn2+ uptake regulation protein
MTDHCLYMYGVCRQCRSRKDSGDNS